MREQLAALAGRRLQVVGIFAKYGSRPYFKNLREETVMLEDLRTADGAPLADHLWFLAGARFAALDLRPGDVVSFTARVRPYAKYRIYRRRSGKVKSVSTVLDYCLAYPGPVRKIAAHAEGSN